MVAEQQNFFDRHGGAVLRCLGQRETHVHGPEPHAVEIARHFAFGRQNNNRRGMGELALQRIEAIGEYLAEGSIAPIVMIRRGAFKFIHSPADPDQLYDLAQDPGERQNLASDPARAELVAEFRAEIAKRWNLAELDARVRLSQRRRRLVDAALSKGKIRPWDFQPFRNAAKQYVRNSMDLDDLEAMARFPPVAPAVTLIPTPHSSRFPAGVKAR